MFYVNDNFYDTNYIDDCFYRFNEDPIISQCKGKRFTVCMQDAALWIALCLYIKEQGGSVFPLPVDTPIEAARRRAKASQSHYLLFGNYSHNNQEQIEIISSHSKDCKAVLVQMSSGTTGAPKVIERSWSTIDNEIDAYVQHFPEADTMIPVIAAPVTHSYGLICGVLVAFKRNVVPTIISNLNPKYILRKLQNIEQPILYSSPALINTLAMLMKTDQMIHAIMTSGTLMQQETFNRVKSKTYHLYQQYGCSEAGCISLGQDICEFNNIGSPLPHHIVNTGINENSTAEIIVSGEDTINTGDIAYIDDAGNLRFISRIDDMINVAGLNVYPSEVENVILTMPTINDAVVFKRKHNLGNEQVCLNFVAEKDINPEIIRQWCREQLATHQIPMHIKQVTEITKLPNGKINRRQLAELV